MTHSEALYNLNPLNRFTDKVENYAKYRPTYPEELIDKILEGLASPPQIVVADIGAGTGIAARQLAERGVRVIAIEPNAAMRNAGKNAISLNIESKSTESESTKLKSTGSTHIDRTCRVSAKSTSYFNVEWKDGTAETTNLPDTSVDLITSFQAFHWFKPKPTLLEFSRVLKSSGRLALVFNDLNRDDNFTKEYHKLILTTANNRLATDFNAKVQPLRENPKWYYLQDHIFAYQQELDLAKLIGLAKSVSFISSEETIQKQLVADLEDLYRSFANEDGFVNLQYCASLHIAELIP
ncbi:class I SAM-dependent methyltransferase [Mastigocoleus testarum]|uniref:Methyltransferase type 11 n=1 Tax=Mastigocoleus testarum BC008 TaxID=371196 RepID=A0A0V7ZS19_9CYAN|nr:class I SAM-dependent methyltransferase [Mastigocoleus testarum]KST66968.1 methyltransferase type 11 [Mastigocoleus testarum BC008]KST67143.1 methyltransferase type 11 [Mastigocoleus testarum BC008]